MEVCWRLLVVILVGILFISSTRLSEIKAAVEWYLGLVPMIPERRVGTMISLLVRFLPLIIEEASETSDAQRARGVELRKNPIYRMKAFSIPLFRRIFQRADKLALAMEARCYSDNLAEAVFASTGTDWIALLTISVLCLLLIGM